VQLRPHLAGAQKLNFSTGLYQSSRDGIWLVSFMDCDLGYFDLETRVLEPLENRQQPYFRSCAIEDVFANLPL